MSQTFGPYSPIRKAGNTYYISGQIGVNPITKTAASDISTQTQQALQNMQALLAEHSLAMDNIVKTTIFVTDMSLFAEVNAVYETFFAPPRPARSTVGVKEIPRVAGGTALLVEVEAVAYKENV